MDHRTNVSVSARTALCSFLLAIGCHGELVPRDIGVADGGGVDGGDEPTWGEIGALLAAEGCISCHGDAGGYSVESYAATLGPGTDATPNVIAGDASSALLVYAVDGHGGLDADGVALVEAWVLGAAAP